MSGCNIFKCEDIISLLPISYRSVYPWLLYNNLLYNIAVMCQLGTYDDSHVLRWCNKRYGFAQKSQIQVLWAAFEEIHEYRLSWSRRNFVRFA